MSHTNLARAEQGFKQEANAASPSCISGVHSCWSYRIIAILVPLIVFGVLNQAEVENKLECGQGRPGGQIQYNIPSHHPETHPSTVNKRPDLCHLVVRSHLAHTPPHFRIIASLATPGKVSA